MLQIIILPIMRILGTLTLSVTIMLGGPIALSISQEREAQVLGNKDISDGCSVVQQTIEGEPRSVGRETPPCTMID